ncbi:hypothetical protein FPSE_02314 [Fusarium pseudograminearum CS3096]|uniref:Peptidase S8/S53 domain-containing protein n=1 Tax=Fusarium pseudograminearum (strain CS3096) TaxID=1028729 RepID=K3UXK3_FUSPC|nr:hypothetical protein FPSE_02314 [Fusarium pseudograminearum CS3096]EKJ77441.1 hypothetical protein FPSE_02314 [Fusarium pseudograminearum CS3096]KAF0639251.1 hypothetical protein FPSE5266_02314 [Fusarium pseudograminearum]
MVSIVDNSSLETKLSFNRYRVNDAMADGEGVIVYVMDSGHNPDPQSDTNEQIFFPGKVEFPQQDGDFKPTTEPRKLTDDLFKKANPKFKVVGEPTGTEVRDDSKGQHGPSMSALIGASKVGVAPRCRVAPLRCTIGEEPDIKECIKCCETILTYHNKKHAGKPAVVNCSLTIPYQNLLKKLKANGNIPVESLEKETEILFGKFQKAVESLVNAGMIIVASGGNQKHTTNTTWAEWKADQGKTDPMFRAPQCFDNVIVVGGLGRDGKVWKESGTGKLVKHYVLADQVENPFNDSSSITGTSVAAAFLSGIIACILSSAQYKAKAQANVDDARKHIRQILEKVSEDFDDGNGNKCRAFMAGTIDLKNVVWEYKV